VDPVPDPLLLRKYGSAENRIRDVWICSQELLTTRPQRRSEIQELEVLITEPLLRNGRRRGASLTILFLISGIV
jgi:hypothetical protein